MIQHTYESTPKQLLTGLRCELLKHTLVHYSVLIVVCVQGDCSGHIKLAGPEEAEKKGTVLTLEHNPFKFRSL